MKTEDEIAQAIEQLSHAKSPKRRGAAKTLRRNAVKTAGQALLDALQKEVRDPRTWETQYQMVMAIGESGYTDALPFLCELASGCDDESMVGVGLGDGLSVCP
ncbi:MAG: HEAT repeat domain-containing protein [Acidiferrobacterales bacterium]